MPAEQRGYERHEEGEGVPVDMPVVVAHAHGERGVVLLPVDVLFL